jgi:hypothetical protein
MDFINRGVSGVLIFALLFLGIAFLINILPVLLLIGAGVWGTSYLIKRIKSWNKTRENIFKGKKDNVEIVKNSFGDNFSNENVIDVEYTEVK